MAVSPETIAEENGDLRLFIDGSLAFTELIPWQQLAALRAQNSLNAMASRGHLDLQNCRRMFEFGAGTGGGTFALARLAELNGGSVEVAELEPEHADIIARSSILPAEDIRVGDGTWILRQQATRGKRYDLVAAFMFGPDRFGRRMDRLLPEVGLALDEGGKLIVSSDPITMDAAREVCRKSGVGFDDFRPVYTQGFGPNGPDQVETILISGADIPRES